MDDSDAGRGTPVHTDAWMQAHTPVLDAADAAPSNMDRKKRRSWFTGQATPVKTAPIGTQKHLESHTEEEEVATIQITHFTKKVILSFDDVRLGCTKVMTLRLVNPHDYPQEVELEKFPFQKGFSVPETVWEIEANQSLDVPVSWTPSEEKNVRELVTFKCEGVFRLQLIVLGTVKVPKKKKNLNRRSTFTARKGQAIQSRRSVAVTNPRRETFFQKKSSPSQPFQDRGKENKLPIAGRKVISPRTRKGRARSVGTVLEKVLTPRQALPQEKIDRVMVGDKECLFSPQLTAKAIMEITGESPFADGRMKSSPRKETLTLCDGMSPLLTSTGNQSNLRKMAFEKETGPLRRLSKEQTSTVTKKSPSSSRLSDENVVEPHHLVFLEPDVSDISQIVPTSSVFEPLEPSITTRLSSTRIDDIVYPAAAACAPFFLAEETDKLEEDKPERSPSIEDDSLEADKSVQDAKSLPRSPRGSGSSQLLKDVPVVHEPKQEQSYSTKATLEKSKIQGSSLMKVTPETSKLEESSSMKVASGSSKQEQSFSMKVTLESSKLEQPSSMKVTLESSKLEGSSSTKVIPESSKIEESSSLKVAFGSSKLEGSSSMKVSLGSSKRSPGNRTVAAPKRPTSRALSRPSCQTSTLHPSKVSPKDFAIHKSVVTGRLNRKRLSDPISDQAVSKKSRPSPENKTSPREPLRAKKPSAVASSRQINRTVMLRKAAATGKPAPAKVSAKPKGKPKPPKAVKGVPMAKLQLLKPAPSALPRHPLPFASKNIFYDERWMEKQERAFTCWLNYVLTPDIDTPKDPNKQVKIDAHLLCLEGTSKVGPAPSREDLSLRAYTARRRLNRLRRGACIIFQSEPVIRVMQKLEAEVEKGRIVIRSDKMLHADLGIKQELLDLILSYNPLWLRIGLETIYGELLPILDNSDINGISRFVVTRLLGNPDIAATYAHPTVPNLFGPGYQAALAEFTLKKFLMLVFFLDRAKLTRLIDHDPCLFSKNAQVKSSRDLLLEFSRRYLKGEGDITRHLSFLGYSVTHVQKHLDEFDFAVNKLAVDLRCGVRLSRVVELLTQDWSLSKELRVPAISRLQKIHNIEVAFKTLKERGIDVEGGGLNERVIVDGHREKTLQLLWRIIFHYQVAVMLNEEHLREEIAFLTKNRKLREKLDALQKGGNDAPSHPSLDAPHLYFKSPQLMLLMDWCKAVCLFYDLQIENFTVSFCDGRALCLLVHHYHPSLLPYDKINQETTLMQFQREEREEVSPDSSFDGTWSRTFSPRTGKETNQEKLLANERQNFKHLYEAVNELGGVPMMVKSADMSNTIPDEKVVITYVSYLCARLLDLRKETRAARAIQLAWRAYRLKMEQKMRTVREKAASTIQSSVRAFLLKRRNERIGGAVVTIQTAIRCYLAKQTARRLRQELVIKKQCQAVTLIQATLRGFFVRQTISRQHAAALIIQRAARGHMVRLTVARMQIAAKRIQGWYRSQCKMKMARQRFVQLKRATISLQAAWRGIMVRRLVKKQQSAAVVLQTRYRTYCAVRDFTKLRAAVVKMQLFYRSKVAGEAQRANYCALRDAAIVFQKVFRGRLSRRDTVKVKSAVKIQATFRGHLQRVTYLKQRKSMILIQAAVRGHQTRRQYKQLRRATVVIQTHFRAVLLGRQVCREYLIARGAAITIQSAVRCFQQRQRFIHARRNIILIQAAVRGHIAEKKYSELRKAAMAIQTRYRALVLGRKTCREYGIAKGAAITLQAAWKGYVARREYQVKQSAAIKIQSIIRCYIARQRYKNLQEACVVLQRRYRAVCQMKNAVVMYKNTCRAVVKIQAALRGYLQRKDFLQTRTALITLQTSIRCFLARRDFIRKKSAVVILQRRYRALVVGRKMHSDYQHLRAAVITLQASYRCHVQRMWFVKQKSAASVIQAEIRKRMARKRYLQLREAAIAIQTRYRARILMLQLTKSYKMKQISAILVQSLYRGHVQRRIFLRQKNAAVMIQACLRGHLQHRRYLKIQHAVCIIQTRFRAWLTGQACQEEYYLTRGRIITLQALYRGHTTRKMLRTRKAAATTIQANFRCYTTRKRYLRLKQAVLVLQTRLRAKIIAREASQSFQKTRAGIIAIQSLYRGYAQRKELARQHQAVTLIQASCKMFLARSRYLQLRKTALIFQTRFRSLQLGRSVSREYNIKRGAVITLQAAFRGYRQRQVYSKQRHAAIVIQSAIRTHQAGKAYVSLRSATIIIQRQFRANILRKRICLEYNVIRGAAITLQAAYRGHLQRKALAQQHLAATRIQSTFRGYSKRRWYASITKAVVVLQTRFRAHKVAQVTQRQYHVKRGAAITLQAAYRGYTQRKILSRQNRSATKLQATFRRYIARKRYQKLCYAANVLQVRFRALKLGQEIQRKYQAKVCAVITLQAAFKGLVMRRALQKQHEMATRIQACFKGYIQRRRYRRICNAVLNVQRHFRALRLGRTIRSHYELQRSSAIKIQAFYRGHQQRAAFMTMKRSAVRIQAMVRGHLGFVHALRYRQERTAAAVCLQRHWRANGLRDQQVRCFNIQRGAAITIQAATRMYLVQKSIRNMHRAATCIQAYFRCHREIQRYRKTLQAVRVLQDHWRAQILSNQVRKEYCTLKQAATTMQAVYRGLCVRRRIALEHAAATKIESMVRMFFAQKRYISQQQAVVVIQRRFRAQKSCQEQTLQYHLTRGACITIQATIRGFLARRSLAKFHKAATLIQSIYRTYKQRREYQRTRALIILLQVKVRASLQRKKAEKEFLSLKSAAITVQSIYRGLMGRRLAARHRAACCIQSTFRMHQTRRNYLHQRGAAIKIQAFFRMYLATKSYQNIQSSIYILHKHIRGYLEMSRIRGEYLQTKNAVVTIQSYVRRCIARRRYLTQRDAAICLQSNYRRAVEQKRYRIIRNAVLVIQRHYQATVLARHTQHEYYTMRGAAITVQAVFRRYMCVCRYRDLLCHVMRCQARVRGAMARRRYKVMMREKEAAVCIQRHVRGHLTRKHLEAQRQVRLEQLQIFADRVKAHLSIIRLQRAYRNFCLRRAFKQKMNAITTIQGWMRARLQRLRFKKVRQATVILQRGARRYLIKKNAAATKLQSVVRVWLAKRRVHKMHSAALQMQALWRGHQVRKSVKSKKVREARARCQQANRNVTEEKKLRNRTTTALDYLLHYKSMHRIMETLLNLEVVSRLSPVCCERLVEARAVPVLYALIRGCNRSIPCMEMIEMIASIFLNITKHDSTLHAVLDVEDAVATLLDLLQIYREKNSVIFCKTCVILGKLYQHTSQAKIINSVPKTKEKITSLHKLTSRKHAMDVRRIKTKALNHSSSFLSSSSLNASSIGASYVAGTPRKRRTVLGASGSEWNITDPMRAIDFLKRMSDRF